MTRTLLLASLVLSGCTEPNIVPLSELPPKPLDQWLEEDLPSYCPFSFKELMMGEGTMELVESESPALSDPLFAQSFHEEGHRYYFSDDSPQDVLAIHPAWLDLDLTATSEAERYRMTLDASRFDDLASLLPEEYQLEAQGMELAFPACEATFELTALTWEGEVTTPFEVTPVAGEGTLLMRANVDDYDSLGFVYTGGFDGSPVIQTGFYNLVASVESIDLPDGFMASDMEMYEVPEE